MTNTAYEPPRGPSGFRRWIAHSMNTNVWWQKLLWLMAFILPGNIFRDYTLQHLLPGHLPMWATPSIWLVRVVVFSTIAVMVSSTIVRSEGVVVYGPIAGYVGVLATAIVLQHGWAAGGISLAIAIGTAYGISRCERWHYHHQARRTQAS